VRARHVLLALLLACPGPLAGQQRIDRGFKVDPDVSVRITSPVGGIRVIGWERDSIHVTGEIPPTAGQFYGAGKGSGAKLGIERSEQSTAPGATLEVRVPLRARVWIKTIGAYVDVSGTAGELDLSSVTGDARIAGAPRVVSAETLEGAITADLEGGVARLRTGAGPIRVRAGECDLTAVSVDGLVEVESPRLARARLESVGGTIRFTGNLAPGAALEAETHAGDVVLRFVGPVNAEFELAAVAGALTGSLLGKVPLGKGTATRFTVGDGGAEITARTFKGRIVVDREG